MCQAQALHYIIEPDGSWCEISGSSHTAPPPMTPLRARVRSPVIPSRPSHVPEFATFPVWEHREQHSGYAQCES